jgi:hypothetical protein
LARVSLPWTVFASAHRLRPCSVFGPVDLPPWVLHTSLPFIAGALHWTPVRREWALHCLHMIRPPAISNVKFVDMFYILLGGSKGDVQTNYALLLMNRTFDGFVGTPPPCFSSISLDLVSVREWGGTVKTYKRSSQQVLRGMRVNVVLGCRAATSLR